MLTEINKSEDCDMKKALITGITGQDGSYLAELLLEKEYQKLTGRKLTVRRLGEVMAQPRCPDLGMEALEVSCEAPSAYLKYEKNRLKRLKHISCLQHGTGQAAQTGDRSDWR